MKAGVHRIPEADYHADPAPAPSLSSGIARALLGRSPAHARQMSPRLNPDWAPQDKKAFDIGRAAHRAVLGVGADFVEIPNELLSDDGGVRSKAARDFVAEVRAADQTPLKPDEVAAIDAIADAVQGKLHACGVAAFNAERSELVALAEIDGVWCRAMIDSAPADARLPLYDLKTTTDASPEAVVRTISNFGYDVQAQHYLDTWKAATGEDRRFRFLFVEKEPPFACSIVELHADPDSDADWSLDAASKTAEARRIWGECLAADYWPAFPDQVAIVGAPAWHRSRWADREIGRPITRRPSKAALDAAYAAQKP